MASELFVFKIDSWNFNWHDELLVNEISKHDKKTNEQIKKDRKDFITFSRTFSRIFLAHSSQWKIVIRLYLLNLY